MNGLELREIEKKEIESNLRMRNSVSCCSVSFPFKRQQSISRERGGKERERVWVKMRGHVKERKVFYHNFSQGSLFLCRLSVWSTGTLWLSEGILVSSGGNAFLPPHTHRKVITYSTQSSAKSHSKAPYDSPSHWIGAGKEERTESLKAPLPQGELNRWMEGQTGRWRWDKDEQRGDRSIKLRWLVMQGT